VPSNQINDDADEAFMRSLIRPEEDRSRLYPTIPWEGGFRWFRSPNVVPIERYRQAPKQEKGKTETGVT
jgi:hypothetical protein